MREEGDGRTQEIKEVKENEGEKQGWRHGEI